MSSNFEDRLSSAVAAIDERGHLPLNARRALHLELLKNYGPDKGERIWVRSNILSARQVLRIWRERFSQDSTPDVLLTDAQRIVDEERSAGRSETRETLKRSTRLGNTKADLDNKFDLGDETFPSIYAGFAAWSAARAAVDRSVVMSGETEIDIEPQNWDAAFLASLAESGGAVWEPIPEDDERRRQFWLWYLREALPGAIRAETT